MKHFSVQVAVMTYHGHTTVCQVATPPHSITLANPSEAPGLFSNSAWHNGHVYRARNIALLTLFWLCCSAALSTSFGLFVRRVEVVEVDFGAQHDKHDSQLSYLGGIDHPKPKVQRVDQVQGVCQRKDSLPGVISRQAQKKQCMSTK